VAADLPSSLSIWSELEGREEGRQFLEKNLIGVVKMAPNPNHLSPLPFFLSYFSPKPTPTAWP
jgi:hypothetical protein